MTEHYRIIAALLLGAVLLIPAPGTAADADSNSSAPSSVEERRLRVTLEEEYQRLQEREKALEERELKLKTLQQEVDKRIVELQALRSEVDELLKEQDDATVKRAAQLAKMYEKMEAAKAARLLVGLEENLAVLVMGKMKAKSAGRVMNNLDADTAARLSHVFTTRDFD